MDTIYIIFCFHTSIRVGCLGFVFLFYFIFFKVVRVNLLGKSCLYTQPDEKRQSNSSFHLELYFFWSFHSPLSSVLVPLMKYSALKKLNAPASLYLIFILMLQLEGL